MKLKKTMAKKYNYHKHSSYIHNGVKTSMTSQLYQTGVYIIIDNNPALQFNLTPSQMVSREKKLIKGFKDKEIEDLVLLGEITVIKNEDGFWEELNE